MLAEIASRRCIAVHLSLSIKALFVYCFDHCITAFCIFLCKRFSSDSRAYLLCRAECCRINKAIYRKRLLSAALRNTAIPLRHPISIRPIMCRSYKTVLVYKIVKRLKNLIHSTRETSYKLYIAAITEIFSEHEQPIK